MLADDGFKTGSDRRDRQGLGAGAISVKLGPKALPQVEPRLAVMLGTVTLAVAVLA